MKRKKRVRTVIIAILVITIIVGGVSGVVVYRNAGKKANVVSVDMLRIDNEGSLMSSEGIVCDDAAQSIYLTEGKKAAEVYVVEGQQVRTGDKLMAYDVSSLELSIQMKQLEISSYENQLKSEKEKLAMLKATKPVKREDISQDVEAIQQQPVIIGDVIESLSTATGEGTVENPYVVTCREDSYVSGALLNEIMENSVVVRFVVGDEQVADMMLTINGASLTRYDDNDVIKLFLGSTVMSGDTALSDESEQDTDDEDGDSLSYTAEELLEAINDQSRNVAETDLNKRMAESELRELNMQLEDGIVYAKKNGIVTTVSKPENPPTDGTPFLQLSGAEGLYISGTVAELALDKVKVGQSITAINYVTGDSYDGVIKEISTAPSDGELYYGESNPNSSYYEYMAYIENPQGLRKGDYLELCIDIASDEDEESIFIDKAYIRKENGKSYVYMDDAGKLVRKQVITGKMLWGSFVEIKSGITSENYIAFPYGVHEGQKTTISDDIY